MESLKVDRSLLDTKFEGYKFSLEELKVSSTTLPCAVNRVILKEDVFSFKHMKAFGITNHLILDMWASGHARVYYVDERQQVMQAVVQDSSVSSVSRVFQVPVVEPIHDQVNVSVSFPSCNHAVVTDGVSKLYILNTSDRTSEKLSEWKLALSHDMKKPFIILQTLLNSSTNTLSCLLLSIVDDAESKHIIVLDLLIFSHVPNADNPVFTLEDVKQFNSSSVPTYAALEPSSKALLLANEKPFVVASESDCSGEGADEKTDEEPPCYVWAQSNEFVTVKFTLPENTEKGDITCEIQTESVNVQVGKKSLLSGNLFAKIDSSESTWTLQEKTLEVHLVKQLGEHHWTTVVQGDERGKYEMDPDEVDRRNEINKKLDQFTSDKLVDPCKSPVVCEQRFEACDDVPEDWVYILRMEIDSGEISHKVSLASHQWVFTSLLQADSAPAFCLRHDVDGLVWQPKSEEDKETQWEHIGTFNALGFVQASKQNRKFSLCSPNLSFAVICDQTRHAYIYHQVKNKDKHARQQVVTLDSPDKDILGVQASNDKLFILTSHSLNVVDVC